MNFLKRLYKKLYQKYERPIEAFSPILIIIFIFYLLSLYSNSPIERFIKLSPEDRVARDEGLKEIDSIINRCKSINRRYTRQKPYQYWYEDIYSFGEWYQPRRSNPVVKVYFNEEPGHSDNGSYCEVDLIWFDYQFYNTERFEMGYDQYVQMQYRGLNNWMCDDMSEENQCTK